MADNSNYYPGDDFDFEIADSTWEQQNQASGSLRTTSYDPPVITRKLPSVQTTLYFPTMSKEKGIKLKIYK